MSNKQRMYEAYMQAYIRKTPRSEQAYREASVHMPGGETRTIVFFPPHALTVERAEGPWLYDADGNVYIDFLNNYTSMIHGHAHPAIADSIRSALLKGICYGAAIPEQAELAALLCARVPGVEKVRFCHSGTEAVLFALRAARAHTGKPAVIKMEGGFHGSIDAVQHSIAPKLPHRAGQPGWTPVPDAGGIPPNAAADVYIAPFNDADAVEALLREYGGRIAAIVVEPVLGQTGAIRPLPGYLPRLRELADRFGALLLFDEVQSLRLDYGGAQSLYGVIPDLTTMGKFIGGGLPVAAFGGKSDVMDVYNPHKDGFVAHSGTFNGHRIGMAAGVVSLALLDREAIARLNRLAERLEAGIAGAIARARLPVSVTRAGSMLHVHFVPAPPTDYASTRGPNNDLCKIMHLALLNEGVFIAPRGSLNLSTVMSEEHIDRAIAAFDRVFAALAGVEWSG